MTTCHHLTGRTRLAPGAGAGARLPFVVGATRCDAGSPVALASVAGAAGALTPAGPPGDPALAGAGRAGRGARRAGCGPPPPAAVEDRLPRPALTTNPDAA